MNQEVALTSQEPEAPKPPVLHWPDARVIVAPNDRLKVKSLVVTDEEFASGAVKSLIQQLTLVMTKLHGAGLSAIQINIPRRVFILDQYLSGEAGGHRVFINPTIDNFKGQLEVEEGCLSFPNLLIKTKRHESLTISAVDEKNNPFVLNLEGMAAVAVQHEYDHLDGITFLDTLSKLKRDFYKKKYQKLNKRRGR